MDEEKIECPECDGEGSGCIGGGPIDYVCGACMGTGLIDVYVQEGDIYEMPEMR